jgi:hypothetical protein
MSALVMLIAAALGYMWMSRSRRSSQADWYQVTLVSIEQETLCSIPSTELVGF